MAQWQLQASVSSIHDIACLCVPRSVFTLRHGTGAAALGMCMLQIQLSVLD
eukprot:CAMPEP_0178405092 /NCGR_PEP_ID=MMETSP0689_2-20121128/18223_1 /TAXON_ID=160604 /ORGANISM="Amphidinium massartii, Strain CS-259" /LENGTH=50 /DNA_ID=CAMNT_0020026101 /DNA_START=128 /DNA_END=277 /DNA_ORIENTATION=-